MACGKGFIESVKEYKGAKPSVWLKCVFREIKWAWQRAWRGFDDTEIIDIEGAFFERTERLLKAFRDSDNYGCFPRLDNTNEYMSEAETYDTLTRMIWIFKNTNDDACYEEMYGISPYEDPIFNFEDGNKEEARRRAIACSKETERYRVLAREMFVKWLPYLWT